MTSENVTMTPVGPERIGECRVLRDIVGQPGIETVEGRLVPLMGGNGIRSHVIVMHPGQYCFPHPHPTESLIYTISGSWVFATTEDGEEVRTVIGAGDLFHFQPDVPTGFEVPFDEPAVILILKGEPGTYEEMRDAMASTQVSLAADAADGEVFQLDGLPEDHAARRFAAEVAGRAIDE